MYTEDYAHKMSGFQPASYTYYHHPRYDNGHAPSHSPTTSTSSAHHHHMNNQHNSHNNQYLPYTYGHPNMDSVIMAANQKAPRRYFTLGVICCCLAGIVFFIGILLMVWGSSPHEPDAIWFDGIALLLAGGLLFFMGIASIGLYMKKEERHKKELDRARTCYYTASLATSGRHSVRNNASDIYLID